MERAHIRQPGAYPARIAFLTTHVLYFRESGLLDHIRSLKCDPLPNWGSLVSIRTLIFTNHTLRDREANRQFLLLFYEDAEHGWNLHIA